MERANTRIMRLLRSAGADVLFVAESRWGSDVIASIESAGCRWVDIQLPDRLALPSNPVHGYRLVRSWLKTHAAIRTIFQDYHPTHLYLTNLSFFLYSLPLAGGKDVTTVFRLPNPPDSGLTGWKQWISDWLWRRVIAPRCDILICNSRYTCRKLAAVAGSDDKIELIYNSLPDRDSVAVSDLPEISRERFNVVYLGRIQKAKGVELLYEAARAVVERHEAVDFYLAGQHSWRNPFAESLILRNREAGLSDRIVFLDQISDVPGLLENAHLHVCPSISTGESFPNVILEAKQAGIPSVVFPTAGLPEAVVDGVEGIVCPNPSSTDLAETIERYVSNPAMCRDHGVAARKSLRRHDESKISDDWIRVLTGE